MSQSESFNDETEVSQWIHSVTGSNHYRSQLTSHGPQETFRTRKHQSLQRRCTRRVAYRTGRSSLSIEMEDDQFVPLDVDLRLLTHL